MTRLQANLLLTFTAIIWGSTFVVQQIGLGELGPITFTASRFLLGALVVLPLALRQLHRVAHGVRPLRLNDLLWIWLTGLVLFLAAVLQQVGILHTSVTNSGFLTALYVPLVPLIALLALRHRVHWSVWPAATACLIGTWLLGGGDRLSLSSGDLWVIASALFWAVHVLLVGYVVVRTQAPLVVAATQFLVVGTLGMLVGAIAESPQPAHFISAVYGILYAGLLSVGLGFTIQVIGQRYTEPADAAIILSSETLFAAIGGLLLLGERLSLIQVAGAALILTGILAVQLAPLFNGSEKPAATVVPE
ncbi:MAG: DMT family transporter [Gammaproteobacteria bacterium]|nr:DMT family transporter [Gammaproteobacteria bacterium]